jgi:tetratricopeptide (TPR) repeat protein
MSFVCKNIGCSAPENKKGRVYPSEMECPFCDLPLIEVLSFTDSDLKLINNLPYVIAYPLKKALTEKHAWTKINLLKDTFLNYLKYLGLITASEFFNGDMKDKKMVALFQQALAEPSFGSWNQYIRETLSFLKENNHHFFCPDLMAYYELVETGKKRKLFKGEIEFIDANGDVQLKKQEATAIGMLINFRNRYLGHGLTLDEDASKKLWDEYYPIFSLLLEQLNFANKYPMFKHEHGETYLLQTPELQTIEKGNQTSSSVWIESPEGEKMNILPFYVVPGELSIGKEDKEQILIYESYTGKTIKFFSPEGTEKQTSGKVLEKLNLLLRDKQKEHPYSPDTFTKEVFLHRIADENKLILDTLTAEKKYIPGVYVHREEMEIKLREWIGARANIFFIAAEAGSGKTNLLIEMQKQYAEQNISVLFIRAARMEKPSLRAQIAYLLNIQPELSIEQYQSIAGTQANPTFIFIDGLNEALQAESIWQEILNISKISVPGSLKFVVSSRANSSEVINSFTITDADELHIYGEKKEGHTGLGAYAFWLTALNMAEMKNAWQAYALTNKIKYKPQFSFDDLATFDRSIYNLISNPLVLRIFLETYHNKSLPKKGNKHLNIWQDWLATFSKEEITFLKLLTKSVWDKGENELSLDDLLNNPQLKQFLTSDLINAPYPRLKNLGWISRYTKDFNACLSFTVEGFLLYLLGSQLMEDELNIEIDYIKNVLASGTKIQKSGVEAFLIQKAVNGDLTLICNLIDAGGEYHHVFNSSILLYTKLYGVTDLLDKLLKRPTNYDVEVLSSLIDSLDKFQLFEDLKALCLEILKISKNNLIQVPLNLKISILEQLTFPENETLISEIETEINYNNIDDVHSINLCKMSLAFYFSMNGFPDKAVKIYNDVIDKSSIKDPILLNKMGVAYDGASVKSSDSALATTAVEYYHNALKVINFSDYKELGLAAMIYFNLAKYEKNDSLAIEYYSKCLKIERQIYGDIHKDTSRTIAAIGLTCIRQGDLENALINLNEAKSITETLHGDLTEIYDYLGFYHRKKGELDKALEYCDKVLKYKGDKFGKKSPEIIKCITNVGDILFDIGDYQKSLFYFCNANYIIKKQTKADIDTIFYINNMIALANFSLKNYDKAIKYYTICINTFNKHKSPYQEAQINNIYYDLLYSYLENSNFNSTNAINVLNKLSKIAVYSISTEDFIDNQQLIGYFHFTAKNYTKSIDAYNSIIPLLLNGQQKNQIFQYIGTCYELLNQYEKALNYFLLSIDIRKCDSEFDLDRNSAIESIQNAIRIAKLIGKEDELPEWLINYSQS